MFITSASTASAGAAREQLDWGETDEAPVRTHGHHDADVEGGSAHPVQHRRDIAPRA